MATTRYQLTLLRRFNHIRCCLSPTAYRNKEGNSLKQLFEVLNPKPIFCRFTEGLLKIFGEFSKADISD